MQYKFLMDGSYTCINTDNSLSFNKAKYNFINKGDVCELPGHDSGCSATSFCIWDGDSGWGSARRTVVKWLGPEGDFLRV